MPAVSMFQARALRDATEKFVRDVHGESSAATVDVARLHQLVRVYEGSDGDATTALYRDLETRGPVGHLAVNLFRACKTSARAKLYRGGNQRGSYRRQSYDTKQWALGNLVKILTARAEALGVRWGWQRDPKAVQYVWVLYVELPTGQVSFHTDIRGLGPEYPREWDGVVDATPERILRWASSL